MEFFCSAVFVSNFKTAAVSKFTPLKNLYVWIILVSFACLLKRHRILFLLFVDKFT